MESILRGIVASNHKEAFKEQLLKKVNTYKKTAYNQGAVEKGSEVVQSQEVHWCMHEEVLAHIDRIPYFSLLAKH